MISRVSIERLRRLLLVGVAYHHAGLQPNDRDTIERLYIDGMIIVLVATSTLAAGINLPAHCVIIKGTNTTTTIITPLPTTTTTTTITIIITNYQQQQQQQLLLLLLLQQQQQQQQLLLLLTLQ